jgi:hypothetical protein
MTALEPVRRPTAAQVAARLDARQPPADTLMLATAGPPTQPVAVLPVDVPTDGPADGRRWWLLVGAALVVMTVVLALTGPDGRSSFTPPEDAPRGAVVTQVPTGPPTTPPASTAQPTSPPNAPAVAPVRPGKGHHGKGHDKH